VPIRKSYPVYFSPKGISDAFDATEAFEGACQSLQNLIFDQQNPELVTVRPGVGVPLTTFQGFTLPTYVSVFISIGTVVYGMVSTSRFSGMDEPFAFDTATMTFIPITGSSAANLPSSPNTDGFWNPPSMTVVSTKIIITHPGFSGTGTNFFGVIDISTPSAPVWSSANLATHPLPSVPTWCANLNNRAWYACGNVIYYSDALVPLTATNAGQSLTVGDPSTVRAMTGLPVSTTSAGIVQALLVFKDFQIWQVTGDPVTTNLALNFLSLNVGTSAPRSVVQTPFGTTFVGIDGPYIVDQLGQVRALTRGADVMDQDIQQPFIATTDVSRIVGSYSGGIYRVCVDTYLNYSNTTNDYWFDTDRRKWTGPHTFPYDCACQIGNYFVLSNEKTGAALFKSQIFNDSTTVWHDNGSQVTFLLESSSFPKTGNMNEKAVIESTIELSNHGIPMTFSINALDDQRNIMNATGVTPFGSAGTLWNGSTWGGGFWTASANTPSIFTVPWTDQLVFKKMAIQVSGLAQLGVSIGAFFAGYQDLGYTNQG
jgi:hypothetical protein